MGRRQHWEEPQMIDIGSRWKSVTDRNRWAAGGASFVAKVKATKAVWMPPKPDRTTSKKAAATAKKASRGGKKTAKKGGGAAKKTAKKGTNAAKKAT
jgi:hypothetical protein